MITVEGLTKHYRNTAALQGISFGVERGQVVGFLGPNGAGKSTTMRILTGYLRATAGRAEVAGCDVARDPLGVRRRVGYLPESTPLYQEMLVLDHLRFAAEIRGLRGDRSRRAVHRVVDLCGLRPVTHKAVMELSKGYRQRVGLAQAMVHEPEVLILDEPTSGLDPNQIVEVRRLIAELGQRHTVLLSTHYMQEVERSADRVVILSQGRIVADSPVPELLAREPAAAVLVEVDDHGPAVRAALAEALPEHDVTLEGPGGGTATLRITGGVGPDTCRRVAALAARSGWGLSRLEPKRPGLEDVFRALTGPQQPRSAADTGAGEGSKGSEHASGAEAHHG